MESIEAISTRRNIIMCASVCVINNSRDWKMRIQLCLFGRKFTRKKKGKRMRVREELSPKIFEKWNYFYTPLRYMPLRKKDSSRMFKLVPPAVPFVFSRQFLYIDRLEVPSDEITSHKRTSMTGLQLYLLPSNFWLKGSRRKVI